VSGEAERKKREFKRERETEYKKKRYERPLLLNDRLITTASRPLIRRIAD